MGVLQQKQQVAYQDGSERSERDLGMETQDIGWPCMCLYAFLAYGPQWDLVPGMEMGV